MLKKNTLRNYEYILRKFQDHFNDIELSSITSDGVLAFMSTVSDGSKQNTKKLRFTLLASFFNYIHNSIDPDFQNPCHNSSLRKLFRAGKPTQFKILEKDVIDEIIFRTQNPRNRLLLELMARGCMYEQDARIFPFTYAAARLIVKNAVELVGIYLKPHDLRKHAATYASRSGTPLEIIIDIHVRTIS